MPLLPLRRHFKSLVLFRRWVWLGHWALMLNHLLLDQRTSSPWDVLVWARPGEWVWDAEPGIPMGSRLQEPKEEFECCSIRGAQPRAGRGGGNCAARVWGGFLQENWLCHLLQNACPTPIWRSTLAMKNRSGRVLWEQRAGWATSYPRVWGTGTGGVGCTSCPPPAAPTSPVTLSEPLSVSCTSVISHSLPLKSFLCKEEPPLFEPTPLGSCGSRCAGGEQTPPAGASPLPTCSQSWKPRVLLVLTVVTPLSNAAKTLPGHPGGWELGERGTGRCHMAGVSPGLFLWAQQGSPATAERGRCAGEERHRAGGGAGWEKLHWRNWVWIQDGQKEHTATPLLMAPRAVRRLWESPSLVSSAACQGNGGSLPGRAVLDWMLVWLCLEQCCQHQGWESWFSLNPPENPSSVCGPGPAYTSSLGFDTPHTRPSSWKHQG